MQNKTELLRVNITQEEKQHIEKRTGEAFLRSLEFLLNRKGEQLPQGVCFTQCFSEDGSELILNQS